MSEPEDIMKKILGALAAVCCVATAPAAFAGVDVFVDFGLPRQVVIAQPLPVAYYRQVEPRWHDGRGHFERRHFYRERERHEHFRHRDWR
jgi:hypothetical protein